METFLQSLQTRFLMFVNDIVFLGDTFLGGQAPKIVSSFYLIGSVHALTT